jgi:pyruvate ferredoxin oxidoreductase gamma subunit/2-oxoisovalerate ferredoxin oxidoreductase gamma subunit
MIEIRFHGRGGQGTVLASISLAKAFFDSGYQVQTFPLFGVERRGAPVEAFLRISKSDILVRSNVYTPDHLVVMDSKLLTSIDVTRGVKKDALILINAPEPPKNMKPFKDFKVAVVDAAAIALENGLGTRTRPIINTAMLGAFSRVMAMPDMKYIEKAILKEVPVKQAQNVAAAQQAYGAVKILNDK